jgi:hypothetical protein
MTFTDPETKLGASVRQSASLLRQELTARNQAYAPLNQLQHVTSYGETPVVVYRPSQCGLHHGNFITASYLACANQTGGATQTISYCYDSFASE